MKIYVVNEDITGVPMKAFVNKENAEKYKMDNWRESTKHRDPCIPLIYKITLCGEESK